MSTNLTHTCPICDQSYATKARIDAGTGWKDLYAGTMYDFFTRYRRRCTAREDVEERETVGQRERVVYFHGEKGGPQI